VYSDLTFATTYFSEELHVRQATFSAAHCIQHVASSTLPGVAVINEVGAVVVDSVVVSASTK